MAHGSCGKSSSEAFDHWIHSDEVVTIDEEERGRGMTNKEQTISNLKKLKSFHNGSYGADINRAIKALEDSRWIPVTERLPEEDGRYLCTYKNDAYGDGICIDFGLYEDGEWYVSGAIAWMPLPKPYKEGADNGKE